MSHTMTRKIGGSTFSVEMPTFDRQGEPFIKSESFQRAELVIAAAIASEGPLSGDGFKWMRKSLPLTAVDLGALLGVAPETISRWETGARDVDRMAWIALGDLVLEAAGKPIDARARLQRIADGFKPAKERRVELG